MDYQGIIIEESLGDVSILKTLTITKTDVEPINKKHGTPWLEKWTLHTIVVPEDHADSVAMDLSHALEAVHAWYADFKNEALHYIIFRNKVFKIDRTHPEEYAPVVAYGTSLGIPNYQLDFSPDISNWQR